MFGKGKDKNADYERCCFLCEKSSPTYDEDRVLCEKRGIVYGGYKCGSFMYDMQKRIPKRLPPLETDELGLDESIDDTPEEEKRDN